MNPLARELLERGTVRDLAGGERPLHSHLPALECEVLEGWVREAAPEAVLEIGLGFGLSSLAIQEGLLGRHGVRHLVIDPHQSNEWGGAGLEHLAGAGFGGRFTLVEEPSELVLPRLLADGERFDLAFVDGWHSLDQVLLELYYLNRLLPPGGTLVFDDVHLPSVARAVEHALAYGCYRRRELPAPWRRELAVRVRTMMGAPPVRLAALTKTGEDRRPWDWSGPA